MIRFPHHVHDYMTADDVDGPARTLTRPGFWVFTKLRRFLVIELHSRHCIAIPIFSHGGNGLQRQINKEEYVGIRDAQISNPPLRKAYMRIFSS
jgi:hypothetical protein